MKTLLLSFLLVFSTLSFADTSVMAKKVLGQYGLTRMETQIEESDVKYQEGFQYSQVPFGRALSLAIRSIVLDGEDAESVRVLLEDRLDISSEKKLRETVLSYMNRPNTSFMLLTEDGLRSPPDGESITQNWIFYFYVGDLSDHAHWVIVPRNGGRVYNYGFN